MEVKINATPVDAKEEKKYGKYDEWEINCAVRTIIEAEEIKADAEKMKYVMPLLKEKAEGMKKAISSLQDLRDLAKSKAKD
jgi:hypothetical protein